MVDEMGGPLGALPNPIKQKPIYKKKRRRRKNIRKKIIIIIIKKKKKRERERQRSRRITTRKRAALQHIHRAATRINTSIDLPAVEIDLSLFSPFI